MIGLDTNVLVRFIAQDDARQSPLASTLIDTLTTDNPGFVTLVSLVELVWVMQSCYKASKPEVIKILDMLLRTQEMTVENAETVFKALNMFERSKADFSDCLIERSANRAGCAYTATFDGNAAKTAGIRLVN